MRHLRSHYKSSIRGKPSFQSPLATRSHRVPRRKFIPTRIRITPMVDALNRALAEPDATKASADVGDDSQPSNSPGEGAIAQSYYDEDSVAVEVLLCVTPSSSSSPVPPSHSSLRLHVYDAPLMRDGSPRTPSPPSHPLQCCPPRPSDTFNGGATSAAPQHGRIIVKSEEDQDDEMPPSSPAAAGRPLRTATPLWRYTEKKALITFPGKEADVERIYTGFDYVVNPDPKRYEGDIFQLPSTNAFEDVTSLALSFKCPGLRDEEDDIHEERQRDAIVKTLRRLGAVLGRSLRALDVIAPWPELSFPCVPGILEVIVENFPTVGNLRFGDLQCVCANCDSVYTNNAKFKRLQVAALERQVSGPLATVMLQTVVIERKSMHSLGKDFTKYIGDAEQLADEALFGTFTVTKGEDPTGATACSQQEALLFAQLLKRCLPSALHFLIVTRELQIMYDAPPSPTESLSTDSVHSSKSPQVDPERDPPVATVQSSVRLQTLTRCESSYTSSCTFSTSACTPPPDAGIAAALDDPSFDLSGDVSLRDELSDELVTQDMDYVDHRESLPGDVFAQCSPCIQSQISNDADADLTGRIHGVVFADDRDLLSEFMSMAGDDGPAVSVGSADISVMTPSVPFPASRSSPAGSLFSDGEVYAEPSPRTFDDPGQYWVGNIDYDQLHVPLEDTPNADAPELPPEWCKFGDPTVTMCEEFHPDAVNYSGSMWSPFDSSGLTDFATIILSDDAILHAPAERLPACGYPEALSHDYGVDPGSDSVYLDASVERLGESGEPGWWRDMDTFIP